MKAPQEDQSGQKAASTARFVAVVQKAGRPEQVTLWQPPEKDRAFRQAVKQNRVMTIQQANVGNRKDFGVIGFETSSPAIYLVFPKSLKAFSGKRIVGLKYDLLASRASQHRRPTRASLRRSR